MDCKNKSDKKREALTIVIKAPAPVHKARQCSGNCHRCPRQNNALDRIEQE